MTVLKILTSTRNSVTRSAIRPERWIRYKKMPKKIKNKYIIKINFIINSINSWAYLELYPQEQEMKSTIQRQTDRTVNSSWWYNAIYGGQGSFQIQPRNSFLKLPQRRFGPILPVAWFLSHNLRRWI